MISKTKNVFFQATSKRRSIQYACALFLSVYDFMNEILSKQAYADFLIDRGIRNLKELSSWLQYCTVRNYLRVCWSRWEQCGFNSLSVYCIFTEYFHFHKWIHYFNFDQRQRDSRLLAGEEYQCFLLSMQLGLKHYFLLSLKDNIAQCARIQ